MRILEAEQVGGFADIVPVHQQILTLFDYEGMYVTDGRATGCIVYYIAQITRRIGETVRTVLYRRDSVFQLPVFKIVFAKKIVKTLENIG